MQNSKIDSIFFMSGENCAIVTLDEKGNIREWNSNAQKMKGYCGVEVLAKNFSLFFTKADQKNDIPAQLLAEASKKGAAVFNGWRVRKDGTQFRANTTIVAHFGEGGAVSGFTKVVRDTTEMTNHFEFAQSNVNALINNLAGVMWSVDRHYKLITANNAFDAMLEYISSEGIPRGGDVFKGFPDFQVEKFKQYYDRAFAGETFSVTDYLDEPLERWSEIFFSPIRQQYKIVGAACYSHDITTLKKAEGKLVAANRLYSFLSEINQAIVRTKDELTLYNEACRIAVESGGFKIAWICALSKETGTMRLAGHCGMPPSDIAGLTNVKYIDDGPFERVLEYGKGYVCNNVERDFVTPRWKEWILEKKVNSFMILPLKRAGVIIGAFNFLSSENDYFDSEETRLLEQATADISFALDAFEKEAKRRLAETMLLHSETRLKQAQQLGNLGSWEMDFATGNALWSDQHCRIYGVPVNENIHSFESWVSFIHPDDRVRVISETKQASERLKNYSFTYRIIRRDGTIRHLESNNYYEFDNAGHPTSLYGTALDITDMKYAEEKLLHSEHRLKQAQEMAHFGNWSLDFATGAATWSDEACRIYGVPTGKHYTYEDWISLIHPEDLPHVLDVSKQAEAQLTASDFYHRIVRPDGTIRHIHSNTDFEFDDKGMPIGLYGVTHDITEEKNNVIKLQNQNDQLRQIAWIQSHQVRGPLATIMGLAQLFKNKTAIEEHDLIIEGIIESAEKLDRVICEIVRNTVLS